jgi:dihydrodipicolinate synthase/N-acetylneuraminate lyase
MKSERPLRPLRGIIPPMVTPLASIDRLDYAGLEVLIEHILAGGVHGLFILGTTGEGPALDYATRRDLIKRVCQQVAARVPVLVGITDTAYVESLRLAESAAHSGASAVVAAPPYYFQVSQADLLRLIESWARECALPLYLYNQPALTKMNFDPQTVALASEISNVYGLKDSSGEISYIREVLNLVGNKPEFAVLAGPEHLLAEALMLGAHGGVPGGANLFPTLLTGLYRHFLDGKYEEMYKLQSHIVELGSPIFEPGKQPGEQPGEAGTVYISRLKCALFAMEICSDLPTWPYQRVPPEEARSIKQYVQAHALLGDAQKERPSRR